MLCIVSLLQQAFNVKQFLNLKKTNFCNCILNKIIRYCVLTHWHHSQLKIKSKNQFKCNNKYICMQKKTNAN